MKLLIKAAIYLIKGAYAVVEGVLSPIARASFNLFL